MDSEGLRQALAGQLPVVVQSPTPSQEADGLEFPNRSISETSTIVRNINSTGDIPS